MTAEVPEIIEDTVVPTVETPDVQLKSPEIEVQETVSAESDPSENNSSSGNPEGFEWGNGNGEVPPGQNVDEDGNIVNNGGNTPPGLNRREKPDKEDNPNSMVTSDISKVASEKNGKAGLYKKLLHVVHIIHLKTQF